MHNVFNKLFVYTCPFKNNILFNQHSPTNLKEFACVKTETQKFYQ